MGLYRPMGPPEENLFLGSEPAVLSSTNSPSIRHSHIAHRSIGYNALVISRTEYNLIVSVKSTDSWLCLCCAIVPYRYTITVCWNLETSGWGDINDILFYSILFYSILFYSILFYSILFYSTLFYSMLFYFTHPPTSASISWHKPTKP